MLNDEEERKRRLEEARNIIRNTSHRNSSSQISNSNHNNRLNEARNIINSVNPSKTIQIDNTNEDNEVGSKILYQPTIVNNNKPSDILEESSKPNEAEEKIKAQRYAKKQLGLTDTVTVPENKSNNKAITDIRVSDNKLIDTEAISENAKLATKEEANNIKVLSNSDAYVLTEGEFDRRSNAEKNIDKIYGVVGNAIEGIADFIPSSIDFINSLEKNSIRKGIRKAYKMLGYSEAEIERLTKESMDKFDQYSILSNLNNLMNNEYKESLRAERIEKNKMLASGNFLSELLAEVAPSIGSNTVSMALTAVNPVLGTASFIMSAGGSYLDDAEARGMNEDQAIAYATVMGGFEGITESLITGSMLDKIGRKVVGKGLSEKVLHSWGVSTAENFVQEAIMEPLQEATATVTGGADKANWNDIGNRMLEAGVSGVVSSVILGGASMGIASAENVIKTKNPTIDDYAQAFTDTVNSGKVDVKGIVQGAQEAIIVNGGTQQFYTTTLNQDGNVESVQAVRGKSIENPNSKVNISPTIVKNSNDTYNVIDSTTGILIDSTPYQSIVEAQTRFTDKMNNLDNASINNINNQVAKATMAVYEKTQELTVERTMSNNSQVDQENIANISQNSINTMNTDTSNTNQDIVSSANTNRTIENSDSQTIDTYQTSENQFRNDYSNNGINYTSNTKNVVTNQSNGLNDVSKLMSQISYNSIYNRNASKAILNNVSKNIPNIEVQETNGKVYLNSLNEYGDIAYQQQIPNRPLRGIEIREIVNNAINNADLSNIQANENGFSGDYSNEATNYMSENDKELASYNTDYNLTGDSALSFSEQVEKWKQGKLNKNTQLVILKETPEIYTKLGAKNLPITIVANKLERIYNSTGKQKGRYHGLGETVKELPKAIMNPLNVVKSSTKDNSIVIVTDLADNENNIITVSLKLNGNGQLEINNTNKNVEVNIVTSAYGRENYDRQKREINGDYTGWMQQNADNGRIIYDIDNNKKRNTVRQRLELPNPNNKPLINTSISQQSKNVKNDTNVNNKSMQEKKNNTEQLQKDIKNFSSQVDAVLNNTFPKRSMLTLLSHTPKALKDIGLPDFPITLTQRHLYTIMNETGNDKNANYHGLGVDTIKQLPEAINTPLDIVKSNTNNDSIVLTTYLADNQDRTIIASIRINGKGLVNQILIDSNVMTSAYGRNNYEAWMNKNLEEGKLLYDIDRGVIKKVGVARLQLPRSTNSTTNLNGSISDTSITHKSTSVKNKNSINNNSMQKKKNNTKNSNLRTFKASGEKNIRKSDNNSVYNEQKDIQKELHNRIQNAILSKNSRKNTFLGTVSNKVASKIKSLFGIDVFGRNHIISDNDIRHMIKQHGNQTIEASRGQIAITTKDIEKIPDIIVNYDSIERGSINKDAFTKQDFNTIRYKKQYSDNITYVVEVIPSSSNNLTIKTMWKKKVETNKKNNSSRVNHANNNIDLQNTPEAEPTLSYSSNSITQNKQNVKDNGIRAERINNTYREDKKKLNSKTTYNDRPYEQNQEFMNYLNENEYLKNLMEVDAEQGEISAHTAERLIEQEIRKVDERNGFDNSIPVTKLSDIDRKIEQYLKKKIGKGHFRERAYGIYKKSTDTIRVKEYKDLDNVFHELGHALDLSGRINVNKENLSNELLAATKRHGGYENESIGVQLDEGFAEIFKTYLVNDDIVKKDYPNSYRAIETIKAQNNSFNDFVEELKQDTYNYIHQSPRNRGGLSNMSIGERTDRSKPTIERIVEEGVKKVWDSNYSIKKMQNEFEKINGRKATPSENAYLLTRLASGVDNKTISMLTKGYVSEDGTRLFPGLNRIGEILGNNPERINDLRAYLVAARDLEYKAKSLKTGIRTMDSKRIVEQFYNDTQIQKAAQIVYDTLDGVLQYAVNNKLITEETAKTLRETGAFYVPFQRVIEGKGNRVGRRGAVADIINTRTGSELDIKDVLENIVTNSANIIKQVENNNVLRAVYEQGQETGMQNNIFEEVSAPMRKVGKEQLQTWEAELRRQGIDTSKIDLDKTIDLFVPNNGIVTEKNGSHVVSFFDKDGKRRYLEFYPESTDIFNSLMGMDKNANSTFLKIMRSANMPLRYGATMANIGFAIPNMISDTIQATIYSEAGFVPVLDNIMGIINVLGATNSKARAFLQHIAPSYTARLEQMYDIYQQTGASSSTRMSQYRQSAQELMANVYGVTNSKQLGIDERFVPLKRFMDILTYIPELSESSTRFRVFQKNYEAYLNKGMSETDARIAAALESRDATQDFGRTGTVMHEVNQLIPFSAARVGSAYTFYEKVKSNPKRVLGRTALLITISMLIKGLGYDDEEIEELNQRKKDDNFVFKIGNTVITLKKPQGILKSIINLGEYIQDLFTGHIEEGNEGERLVELIQSTIMDNMPADSVTGLVPNAIAPVVENAINKDFYYNTDIVKSYDLDLPEEQQYYDYTSQLAIWLGEIFHYSPAKIDNLISGYFGSLGTQFTNIIDWTSGKLGISAEEPAMGAEDNAVGKRFVVNVNENSASVDEIYSRKDELTKKLNGGTITEEENAELETIKAGISKISALNKQIKAIKQNKEMSGSDKADAIRPLQQLKTDVARQSLGKSTIYTTNTDELKALEFYPNRSELSYNGLTLNLTEEMKTEYMNTAYSLYKKYAKQGLYNEVYLEKLKEKIKEAAKKTMIQKYKNQLTK